MDNLTPTQRRHCMSRVTGKNTKPEVLLRKALWSKGLRYRLHYKIIGKPDIVFVAARVAVFVDGCFWYGCPEHGSIPKSRREFWEKKIKKSIKRDQRVVNELGAAGWLVLRYWEHAVTDDLDKIVEELQAILAKRKK
ncbi:MAG: very short patch repair endonuclease [Candidatus Thiodiazotropha sp. (ex Ctena orbiculata)]|nr:very short patch repair endonuclease [Candidatus Thiodiazotropha taylori]